MRKIQIMTDSASDISYADEKKYNISVIAFPITLGEKTYTSRVDFDNEQFFSLMAQQLGYEPAAIYQIGAAIAANAGPRVVGAAFTRKKEGYHSAFRAI